MRGAATWLLAGCAGLALGASPLAAQQALPPPDPTELDPSAPLNPMTDLDVEWPDLDAPDPAPPPEVEGVASEDAAETLEDVADWVDDSTR